MSTHADWWEALWFTEMCDLQGIHCDWVGWRLDLEVTRISARGKNNLVSDQLVLRWEQGSQGMGCELVGRWLNIEVLRIPMRDMFWFGGRTASSRRSKRHRNQAGC